MRNCRNLCVPLSLLTRSAGHSCGTGPGAGRCASAARPKVALGLGFFQPKHDVVPRRRTPHWRVHPAEPPECDSPEQPQGVRFFHALAVSLCFLIGISSLAIAQAQGPLDPGPSAGNADLEEGSAAKPNVPVSPAETEVADADGKRVPASEEQIDEWIAMLGAQRFALREQAAMALIREGESVLPKLRQLAESTTDPETRMRATELANQIGQDDLDARIAAFLAEKSDELDGWSIAQRVLGDTGAIRELYVELVQTHPEVASSLEGTSRDRAIAMGSAAARVRRGLTVERRFPTRADAIAMLFPIVFEGVPISDEYEQLLIRVLETEAGSLLYKSATLSGAYQRLVGGWARRSGLGNREDVLWLLMSHDVVQALPLALDTLSKSNDPRSLAVALQAIARFGDHRQASAISDLVTDHRVVVENGFVRGKPSQTQLGDVALATLSLLYDLPLSEVGFEGALRDPKFGIRIEEVGFETSDKERRESTRKRVITKIIEASNADERKAPIELLVD